MERDLELAKRLLESKGYTVSKKEVTESNKSYNYSDHEVFDEAHTVELYKTHTGEPERKRFIDYKSAKEFADSNTENYEEILITIPTVNGPSTVNSWSKTDGWYRTVESKKMNDSEGLKYISNVNGYSTYRKIENGKGVWFAKRQDDPDDKMFPISYDQARGFKAMPDEKEIEKLQRKLGDILLPKNESTDIPHAESYKGYSIQSYDDYGATVYKNGKKIREFENIDDAREYIDGLEESKNPLQEAILRSIKKIHESTEEDDTDDESWKPFKKGKYRVYGSRSIGREDVSDIQSLYTDDPGEAIESWFTINQKTPEETSILTQTKSNAQELIDWAAENTNKIEEWYDKYKCHYKKEYLIDSIRDQHKTGVKYFYEDPHGYGDQISPFCEG